MVEKINIFDTPQIYRESILQLKDLIVPKEDNGFDGKSFICVFLTSYCAVGCPFCFFKSPLPKARADDSDNKFTPEGVENFIRFANEANVGYLQISGGGEPFIEKEALLRCVEEIEADRLILITSGSWAVNSAQGERYLTELEEAISRRKTPARVSIRLSVSEGHSIRLKENPLVNLLNIFQERYRGNENFTLQLKTFEGDTTLYDFLDTYFPGYTIKEVGANESDDQNVIKVMPWKSIITLPSGHQIITGTARIFDSSLKPNLNDPESIQRTIGVFDNDLQYSQNDNASVVPNGDGSYGVDWIVEYNGNVGPWQNRVPDNLQTIYEDQYQTVVDNTMSDPLTRSYMEKGARYRDKIVSEVFPPAVTLSKAVSIRDYTSTLLFEDENIRLYYTLRVLQDYMQENRVNGQLLATLPLELQAALALNTEQLIFLYQQGAHSIINQELAKEQSEVRFNDFMELVELGHFDLSPEEVDRARKHAEAIKGVGHEPQRAQDRRLTRRQIEPKLFEFFIKAQRDREKIVDLIRHGETDFNVAGRLKGQNETVKTHFTDRGLSQIRDIGIQLEQNGSDRIFSSDLERAVVTALLANRDLNLPISFHKELRGFNMGIYQDQNILVADFVKLPEVQAAFRDHNIPIPGGESINQLVGRICEALVKFCGTTEYANLAVIAHGAAISNVNSSLSGEPYRDVEYVKLRYFRDALEVLESGRRP